jgi:hypothetical protein
MVFLPKPTKLQCRLKAVLLYFGGRKKFGINSAECGSAHSARVRTVATGNSQTRSHQTGVRKGHVQRGSNPRTKTMAGPHPSRYQCRHVSPTWMLPSVVESSKFSSLPVLEETDILRIRIADFVTGLRGTQNG